jgi:hypothetical protein
MRNEVGEVTETDDTVMPAARRFPQLLAGRGRRRLQRLIDVDAEHQVHSAPQVEAQLQLFGFQPGRRRQAVAVGQDRIDPEQEKDGENADDRENLPADVLHDDDD